MSDLTRVRSSVSVQANSEVSSADGEAAKAEAEIKVEVLTAMQAAVSP